MQKYNLHVTQVPDHKAQVVLARIIVGTDNMIPLQQAMEMAANPPLLLFHNLKRKDLEQHVEQLNSLGVKFDISEVQEEMHASEVNFGGRRETPESEPEPPRQTEAPLSHPAQSTPPASTPVHAAEHEHHNQHLSGHRIGAIDSDAAAQAAAIKTAEEASQKKSQMVTYIAVAALLLIGLITLNLPKGNKLTIEKTQGLVKAEAKQEKKTAPAKARAGGGAGQNAAGASGEEARPDGEPRVQASARQKQQAGALVDSAKANENDLMKSVAFYKMAISFNRRNLAAWQGLLQAYRELRMESEAYDTEKKMRQIFGNETLSIGNIVKSYGELVDIQVQADGGQIVEYKTAKSSKVDILREVFGVTRAVRAACGCNNISVYASTGSGKGVTARSTQHTSVHSLSEFMRQAEIVWQE